MPAASSSHPEPQEDAQEDEEQLDPAFLALLLPESEIQERLEMERRRPPHPGPAIPLEEDPEAVLYQPDGYQRRPYQAQRYASQQYHPRHQDPDEDIDMRDNGEQHPDEDVPMPDDDDEHPDGESEHPDDEGQRPDDDSDVPDQYGTMLTPPVVMLHAADHSVDRLIAGPSHAVDRKGKGKAVDQRRPRSPSNTSTASHQPQRWLDPDRPGSLEHYQSVVEDDKFNVIPKLHGTLVELLQYLTAR